MSHEIIKPFDKVQSVKGTEWHGLADHVEEINRESVSPMLFPIAESVESSFILNDGGTVTGEETGSKALFANLFEVRPDLVPKGATQLYVPLSTVGEGYTVIPNMDLWESMERAFQAIGVKYRVTTAGTLGKLRKFFISVALEGHEGFTAGGDQILSNINFITSHDGEYSVRAFDSNIRIVCMNTFRWSLGAQGNVGFDVRHTKNAAGEFANLEAFLTELLNGRDVLAGHINHLASMACDVETAETFAKGYLALTNKVKKGMELAARSRNAGIELVELFQTGKGNKGQTLADLWNAGTEYWTGGSGTGKKAAGKEKVITSQFGMAAEHKEQWLQTLLNPEAFEKALEIGKGFKSLYA